MKLIFSLLVLFTVSVKAQNPCEFTTNVKDSIGESKSTKNALVYEKNFAGASSYMYFSLALTDGMPTLNTQLLQKSKDFIKAYCFDKNSRIYLQLDNGKIVTLFHIDKEDCGTGVRNQDLNNRILGGFFVFTKEAFQDLKSSPVSLMRIKYTTETVDYIMKATLKSELDGNVSHPNNYFIDTLRCLDN